MANKTSTKTESVALDDGCKEKFKKSEHIAFYRRHKQNPGVHYCVTLESLALTEKGASLELFETKSQVHLLLQVRVCRESTIRITIDEIHPVKIRYRVPDVLIEDPVYEQLRVERKGEGSVTLSWGLGQHQVWIQETPFSLDVLCVKEVIATLNPNGRTLFETLQDPPRHDSTLNQGDPSGLWRERFGQFVDVKANGPSSVGMDFCLHGFNHVYGIPEHADRLRLKDTSGGEPYRLYNLDVFGYRTDSRLGLYGSVPLLFAHKSDKTLGLFWLNASETLVDVHYHPKDSEEDVAAPVKRSRTPIQTDVHWISESGVIDCFILTGPTPSQVLTQYAQLTGFPAFPPLWSLGYHQCRWNYEDEADVESVDAGFDHHSIPYDVIWLDIEHTDGKRYFTWDSKHFPNPVALQQHLARKKRKMVVISDPHIKVDPDWSLYCEARDGDHFVKVKDGGVYTGSCWPGDSNYLDFSCPQTRSWYARCYSLNKYKGSTDSLFVWNDMNEPSVFYGPEQTMPKNAVHRGGWEHRDLHNLYGFYQHMATVDGLMTRAGGTERPFVLTRSFFAGSQRLGAVWTGDTESTWDHLKFCIPMLLSISLAGIAFCGADVGGFVGNPEPELLVRWYQAGALQPFFRGHANKSTKRREPWLFGEAVTANIRSAIQQRYCLLPYWYTLFHQAHTSALPPMRPLWVEFPGEQSTFRVDHEYMIGSALLACPVTAPGVKEVMVFLPGIEELWYDIDSAQAFSGDRNLAHPVTLDNVPVFQRGGTVVPRREGNGSCSSDFQKLPLSLTVALDSKGCAEGLLYEDDGHSFHYRDRKTFSLHRFLMKPGSLSCSRFSEDGTFASGSSVQSVLFLGMRRKPSAVTAHVSGVQVPVMFQYREDQHTLVLGGLGLGVGRDWEIRMQ
ncbi:neutral alpha-glucosidase C isoform X2 [Alosa sapidissima]|uniref:neutral alpha-glucosidase C isoform X2 n=1 Tax=Alosa sapidissima TaxID=34773 RepID=UPI001C09F8D9|nr:neutral alpha-glucosidase C isoform X2 [Alosa sapidissima]